MSRFRIAAAIIAAFLLVGCSDTGGPMGQNQNQNPNQMGMGFSNDDAMFASMMIPHHEQAVVMSDLAIEKSGDPDIRSLAYQIKAEQQPEIDQMQSWLDNSPFSMRPGESPHGGHGGHGMAMGGMLSSAEMARLRQAEGAEFDRLFLNGMIEHHEGAISMARMVINSQNNDVRRLAENIMRTQKTEIATMRALLAR